MRHIAQQVLDDSKKRADAGSKVAIKSAYIDGMKKCYEIQGKPLLSLTIGQEHEQVMGNQFVDHKTMST